ncbi:hypothetical protein [Streptomyces sp. SYSU K21746]
MIIVYSPEDGEPERFDARRIRTSEIQIIERTASRRWPEMLDAMGNGDVTAMRTVAWVVKKRSNPSLPYADFDPFQDELRARLDDREIRQYAEHFAETFRADEGTRTTAFEELLEAADDRQFAETLIKELTADPTGQATDPKGGELLEASPSPSDG